MLRLVIPSLNRGQGLVEYALILLLVAVAVLLVLALMGPQVGNLYSQVMPCVSPVENWCA